MGGCATRTFLLLLTVARVLEGEWWWWLWWRDSRRGWGFYNLYVCSSRRRRLIQFNWIHIVVVDILFLWWFGEVCDEKTKADEGKLLEIKNKGVVYKSIDGLKYTYRWGETKWNRKVVLAYIHWLRHRLLCVLAANYMNIWLACCDQDYGNSIL